MTANDQRVGERTATRHPTPGDTCPECDTDRLVADGGCPVCRNCGWSRCAYRPA